MTATTIHTRAADTGPDVLGVSFEQRLIEVIAVPWNTPATVQYRGGTWTETFAPGSLDGLRAHRPHNRAGQQGTL